MRVGWEDVKIFLVSGFDFLPDIVEELTLPESQVVVDETRPAGDAWPRRFDSTQRTTKAPLSHTQIYENGTDSLDALMADLPMESGSVVISIEGNTAGKKAIAGRSRSSSYSREPSGEKLTRVKAEHVINGALEATVILHEQTQETADFDTEADSIDNGFAAAAVNLTSNTIANPTVVTAAAAHGLLTGDTVVIAGVATSDPTINGSRVVTVISPTTFSVPVNVTTGGTGGTVRRTSTRNGGTAYFQLPDTTAHPFDLDGHTALELDVRDSPDDSTFVELAGSAAFTARGHGVVAVSGNVDRYIAAGGDFTGAGTSPTASPVITFRRNPE